MPGHGFQKDFEKILGILRKENVSSGMVYKAITNYHSENGSLFKWLENSFTNNGCMEKETPTYDSSKYQPNLEKTNDEHNGENRNDSSLI